MARSNVANDIVDEVANDTTPVAEDNNPLPFALNGALAIPVSRKAGRMWKEKIDNALEAFEDERTLWDAAFVQYRKVTDMGVDGDNDTDEKFRSKSQRILDENIVRETVKLMLRSTYTRNPTIAFSTSDEKRQPFADCLTAVITALLQRRSHPGVNARAYIRRHIVHTHLTNFGVIKLDYQDKIGSRQEALATLQSLRRNLVDKKSIDDIEEIYAQLEQLEEELPLRNDKGIRLSNPLPHRIIIDPDGTMTDLTDSWWLAEEVPLDNDYIRSKFMRKDGEGRWVRLSDGKGNFKTPEDEDNENLKDRVVGTVEGYTSADRLRAIGKDKTRCWMIYDKLTQTIMLYTDDDWSYPLWVWEPNVKISRFFPYFITSFTEPVDGVIQPGETSFYAGQAEEVNKINRKVASLRNSIFGAIIYNSKVMSADQAESLVKHLDNPKRVKAFGMQWDPDVKWEDMVKVFEPPAYNYKDLFDKSNLYNIINRIASVNDAMRGAQFRTNTNTTAINSYNEAANAVTGELTDIIEETVAALAWSMAEIVVDQYSQEDITALVGPTIAADFQPMSIDEFNQMFSMTVEAGSSEKPTSEEKKKESLEVAQALGQMGQAAPMTTLKLIIRMFKEAFSNFIVKKEDWAGMEEEIKVNAQKGISTQQPPQGTPAQPPMQTRGPTNDAQNNG